MEPTLSHSPTLVIADDDHDILQMLKLVLTRAGFKVHLCWNATNIEAKVREYKPDLILLDITMDGINGGDVCRQLRNPPHSITIPIIMISANHNLEQVAQACDATGHIAKPFSPANLVETIRQYLKNAGN